MKKQIHTNALRFSKRVMSLAFILIGFSVSGYTQNLVHINENFEGFNVGPLPTGTGTGWSSSSLNLEVVSSPAIGNRALNMPATGSGSARLRTDQGPNTELNLAANQLYEWNFSFFAASDTTTTGGTKTTVYLDTGDSVNDTFAALRFEASGGNLVVRAYTNLSASPFVSGSFTTLGNLALDTWHDVTFMISTDESMRVAYTIEAGSLTHSVAFQNSGATTDAVRMSWSPVSDEANFTFDNLYLATIPEPSSVAILLGVVAMSLVLLRKRMGFRG